MCSSSGLYINKNKSILFIIYHTGSQRSNTHFLDIKNKIEKERYSPQFVGYINH